MFTTEGKKNGITGQSNLFSKDDVREVIDKENSSPFMMGFEMIDQRNDQNIPNDYSAVWTEITYNKTNEEFIDFDLNNCSEFKEEIEDNFG